MTGFMVERTGGTNESSSTREGQIREVESGRDTGYCWTTRISRARPHSVVWIVQKLSPLNSPFDVAVDRARSRGSRNRAFTIVHVK